MARAVFQTSNSSVESCLRQLRFQRCPDRSLEITESASRLSSCLPFQKPVLLGCLSRGIPHTIQFQLQTNQHIPFWTGYNSILSDLKPEFTVVSYALIIDAKPSDMTTVFTTMKK